MKRTIIYLMTVILLLSSCNQTKNNSFQETAPKNEKQRAIQIQQDAERLADLNNRYRYEADRESKKRFDYLEQHEELEYKIKVKYSSNPADLYTFSLIYGRLTDLFINEIRQIYGDKENSTISNIQSKPETNGITDDEVKRIEENTTVGLIKTFDSAMGKITITELTHSEVGTGYYVEATSFRVVVGESLYEDGGFMKAIFFDDNGNKECVVTCSPYDFGSLLKQSSLTTPNYITIFDENLENVQLTISLYLK